MNVLLWFTADLRVQNNSAIQCAAGLGLVLPVYVADPAVWGGVDRSARQWDFVAESLRDLRDDLTTLGAPLAVRLGPGLAVLGRLAQKHRCTHLVCRDGGPDAIDPVRRWAASAGVVLHLVIDGPSPDHQALPQLSAVLDVEPGPIPGARMLGLDPDPCPHRQPGGRRRAEAVLATHLARPPTDRPRTFAACERSASRLSPYLAHGVLSAGEVAAAVQQARLTDATPASRRLGAGLLRGLELRRLLHGDAAANPIVVHGDDGDRLAAWQAGQTGLPFADACLRYLAATGWLPDRARALVLSVACHQLGLDWRVAGAHLAAMSTDHDPALFWPLARAAACGDRGRPPRIADPVAEGRAMDPAGSLIHTWVPELKALPDAAIHTPWRWDGARHLLGRRYPEPLVDPVTATRAARAGRQGTAQLAFGFPCPR